MEETLHGIIATLAFIETNLQRPGVSKNDIAICMGLYTFAVEEYGKLVLLASCSHDGESVKIEYAEKFRNHIEKFTAAMEALPPECTVIRDGSFSSEAFDPRAFQVELLADFDSRLAVFYSDLTETADQVVPVPDVDYDLLVKAVATLQHIAMGFQVPG